MAKTKATHDACGIPMDLVRKAKAEPALKGRVFLCSKRREALRCEGTIVGFVTPHQTPSGWRHGPIYVDPAYRGRGLVEAYYDAHPERTCVAFIPNGNDASLRMHERAGFVHVRNSHGGQVMRRAPKA